MTQIDADALITWLERRAGALGDAADATAATGHEAAEVAALRARKLELACVIGHVLFEADRAAGRVQAVTT